MPRYYGQQIDPLEMQQMAGNPFYNPELSRPDWYRGIMSLYANLKGAKNEKEAKQIAAEDKKWTKWVQEQELSLKKQQVTQSGREYETPEQRLSRELAVEAARSASDLARTRETIKGQKDIALAKPTKSIADLNKEYLSDIEGANKQYAGMKSTARTKRLEAYNSLYANKFQYQTPAEFDSAKKQIEDAFNEYINYLDEQQEIELSSIDERYSDLPRARASATRRRGPARPTLPPPGPKISSQAKSSSGKVIDVFSEDGGKTWKDKDGNIIPMGK